MNPDRWGVQRLANHSGTTVHAAQKSIDLLYGRGLDIREWKFDRALIAIRLLNDGHEPDAIAVVGALPHVSANMWLVSSSSDRVEPTVFSSLLQATAHIEQNPDITYRLSRIGVMGLEAVA